MNRLRKWLFVLGALPSFLLVVALVGIGVIQNAITVWRYVFPSDGHVITKQKLVSEILSGFELILVAPLCFLVFVGIWCLVAAACDNQGIPPMPHLSDAKRLIEEIKALITGLMLAVLSTHLVERVLEGRATSWTDLGLVAATGAILLIIRFFLGK